MKKLMTTLLILTLLAAGLWGILNWKAYHDAGPARPVCCQSRRFDSGNTSGRRVRAVLYRHNCHLERLRHRPFLF